MSVPYQLDAERVRAAFTAACADHPGAAYLVVGRSGSSIDVEVTIPLHGERLQARSALNIVVAADRPLVVDGWRRMLAEGAGMAAVAFVDGPSGHLLFYDLQDQHGACIVMRVDKVAGSAHDDAGASPTLLARFGRYRRNDLAAIIGVDSGAERLLGWTAAEVADRDPLQLIHPDDQDLALANWMDVLVSPGEERRWRGRHLCADSTYRWLESTNTNRLEDPAYGDVLCEMVDVSAEKAATEMLREREEHLQRLAEALPFAVVQLDVRLRVLYSNDRLFEVLGLREPKQLQDVLDAVAPKDRERVERAVTETINSATDHELEMQLVRVAGGEPCIGHAAIRVLLDHARAPTGAILCVSDVTESTQMRRELEVRATHDPLTMCLNRGATMTVLDGSLGLGIEPSAGTAVVFLDLDKFKPINDELGHAAGDELLRIVAERLRRAARGGDVVGRMGGDEFVVVCPGVIDMAHARIIASRLEANVCQSAALQAGRVTVHASIGVAWTDDAAITADVLLATADVAMYERKRVATSPPPASAGQDQRQPNGSGP